MRSYRAVVALLPLLTLWPAPALAQEPKAGVVTTLQGRATIARPALPQPIPLKFKDDVFRQDKIDTRENSIVRVLLGGKALVTIRELSTFTVTEEPGRAVVELQSGKLALAVARRLLRPGETVEVRTPHAIAAVRGSLAVIQHLQGVTTIWLLQGALDLLTTDRRPITSLDPGQKISASPAGVAPKESIPPAEAKEVAKTSEAPKPKEQSDKPAGGESIGKAKMAEASQLAAVLAPAELARPTTDRAPIPTPKTSTQDIGVQAEAATGAATTTPTETTPTPTTTTPTTTTPTTTTPTTTTPTTTTQDVPDVQISGTTVTPPDAFKFTISAGTVVLDPGEVVKTFSGTSSRIRTSPVVQISDSTVSQSGAGNLILTTSDAGVGLSGPLLVSSKSSITGGGNLLRLSSTLTGPGPLLDLTDTTLSLTGAVSKLFSGSTLKVTSGPAIRINGGSLTADALVISDSTGNTFDLTGTALDLTNTSVTLRTMGEEVPDNDRDVFKFTLALNEPAIKMLGSALTLTGVGEELFEVGEDVAPIPTENGVALSAAGSTINLKGHLLDVEAVNSTATAPAIQLTNTTISQTGTTDALIFVDPHGLASSMAGPMLKADGSTITTSGSFLTLRGPGSLTSSTTEPFTFTNASTVTSARNFTLATGNFSLALKGSLLDATDTIFNTTSDQFSFFPIIDGASVTTSGTTAPLLKFTGTASGKSKVTAARNFLPMAVATPGAPPPFMILSGPLLDATLTDFKIGDPTSNVFTFVFVGDGAALTGTGPSPLVAALTGTSSPPLLSFDSSSVDTAGNVFTLRRSTSADAPSKLTLSGPLFSATNNSSFNTTSLGFGSFFGTSPSPCCNGFFISQGARLTSTTALPLLQLSNSTFNAGPDAQSGGNFFSVTDTVSGFPSTELVAPASVSLAGPLLSATDSTITALFSLLNVTRSSLTSSSTDPLIQLSGTPATTTVELGTVNKATTPVSLGTRTDSIAPGSPAFGSLLFLISSPTSEAVASDASVSLAGSFLSATNSTIITTSNAINVKNGAMLTSTTTSALFQLNNSSLTTIDSCLLDVFGTGGSTGTAFATVNLNGPLLSASNGSKLDLPDGGFLVVDPGGKVIVNNPPPGTTLAPFVSITGGTQSVGTAVGSAMFELRGENSTPEVVDLGPLGTTTVFVGTDKPLQLASGQTLLEASGATISGQKFLDLDPALLEASAPLLSLKAASSFTTSLDALDLFTTVKLNALGPLFTLDSSTMTVLTGALVKLSGGSFLNVTGDLLRLSNGSMLNLNNGAILNVTGSSVAKISGALVLFNGTGGNLVNITNSACLSGPCSNFGSGGGLVRVAFTGGASVGNASLTGNFVKGTTLGSLNYSSANAAAIIVDGTGSKVLISGQ